MSNKTVLERLLIEIDEYDKNHRDGASFAQRFYDSIDALEGIPYSVLEQARDWSYKIEIAGHFETEGFDSTIRTEIPKLKMWVNHLLTTYD